ncbi:MAG: transglycosylase SLT domain-containing protein [Pyrinomonadaceae bacterium]|nr:transglycosylase SLT domain-containing protein [Pyrinomonadaceae bacterium]
MKHFTHPNDAAEQRIGVENQLTDHLRGASHSARSSPDLSTNKLSSFQYRTNMIPFAHFALTCFSTLTFTFGCLNAEKSSSAPSVADSSSTVALFESINAEQTDDGSLTRLRRLDAASRSTDGKLAILTADEHLRRASVYAANRLFREAREHWQIVVDRYATNPNVPAALFGIGRAFYQERRFAEALPVFERAGRDYSQTEAGRDGFYYVAPTLLRMNRASEAAARYRLYIERFPQGERIENAHLNLIDTLREAEQPAEATAWVARTRTRFAGTATDTNALFGRLRLEVAEKNWSAAVRTADELRAASFRRGVSTTPSEVSYLRAYSLEQSRQTAQAINAYAAIPDNLSSYYGGLATARLLALGGAGRNQAQARQNRVRAEAFAAATNFPAPYRDIIVRLTANTKVDPRLLLAVMRQESDFRTNAKSPAAARGLMQMTTDTGAKYARQAGFNNLQEADYYRPEVSIGLATVYVAELIELFPNLAEAVAASYNGGEDNIARWLARAKSTDGGVFTSEVGFSETKDYVAKVMANYRAYSQLYTRDLRPQR